MTDEQIARATRLWLNNCHTATIAKALELDESEVARHLPAIKKLAATIRQVQSGA